jgi:hypothetical protein
MNSIIGNKKAPFVPETNRYSSMDKTGSNFEDSLLFNSTDVQIKDTDLRNAAALSVNH